MSFRKNNDCRQYDRPSKIRALEKYTMLIILPVKKMLAGGTISLFQTLCLTVYFFLCMFHTDIS